MLMLMKGLHYLTGIRGLLSRANLLNQSMMASSSAYRNRLGSERSPYLLQHANNPVDWYPWGPEAFQKAKEENKIIFLSVGYSTCHWCHVMERESFENEEIGKILSEKFVPVKVDREERPDVDRIYMTFIQATGTGGGWPMSVWLTPDLKPIVGGTYFPPDNVYYGRPGFKTVLNNILEKWESDRESLLNQGSSVVSALRSHTTPSTEETEGTAPTPPTLDAVNKCYAMLERLYDEVRGGFGKAPKFPQPGNFVLLYDVFATGRDSEHGVTALNMCIHTLRMMNKGGMHDHVGKGFHRYSTDEDWHVPHFEKMLYDQAQLATAYADAYQITKDEEFAEVVCDIIEYVNRDLSHKAGGFYSAEDADSLPTESSTEKKEGAFCVWTKQEILDVLSDMDGPEGVDVGELFCQHYDVQETGNVDPYKDPHDELKHQNVLIVRGSELSTAEKYKMEPEGVTALLATARERLFQERSKRPPPHLDNKMITAWNGLMLSGLSRAAQALSEPAYIDRARQAVSFLRTHALRSDGRILRAAYVGDEGEIAPSSSQPIYGFADDYAFLIRGLLDLYEACYDDHLLEWAEELQNKMTELFWDEEGGGYFNSPADDASLVLRLKDDQDGAEPSANSVAAMNLLRLSHFLAAPALHQQASKLLTAFSERLTKIPIALPEMCAAIPHLHGNMKQVIVVGDPTSADTRALLSCVHTHFLPNKVLLVADGNQDGFLYSKLDVLQTLERQDGKATAYVCENYACQLPVTTVDQLEELLTQ